MTKLRMLLVARIGQVLNAMLIVLLVVCVNTNIGPSCSAWLGRLILLSCITFPLELCLYMVGDYQPYKKGVKEWNNDMFVNWKNFSKLAMIGAALISLVLFFNIQDTIQTLNDTAGILAIITALLFFIQKSCISAWKSEHFKEIKQA